MNDFIAAKDTLLLGVREYLAEADANYGEDEVVDCGRIVDRYLEAVGNAPDQATAREAVRTSVLALNALNDRCDGQLIETDQREQLCVIIIGASALPGFNGPDEDVTGEWREW